MAQLSTPAQSGDCSMMIKNWILVALGLLVGGCTTNPIPEGYTGPLAYIQDTTVTRRATNTDIFFASKVNGKPISESRSATGQANYGRGFVMSPVTIGRQIPAQPVTLTIVGRRHYAAPILTLVNKVYEVSGEIQFTPEENQTYVVKGELGENYSAVWLEDARNAQVIGEKIEIKGSAALGIFEK